MPTLVPLIVGTIGDLEWRTGEQVILEVGERAAFRPITVGQDKYEWVRDDTAVWPPSFEPRKIEDRAS